MSDIKKTIRPTPGRHDKHLYDLRWSSWARVSICAVVSMLTPILEHGTTSGR